MRRFAIGILACSSLFASLPGDTANAQTQNYPNQPIRMLVGFAAGGPTDVLARAVGDQMSKALGQPVVVENRPGANAMIAAQAVASAKPDGYTLLTAAGAALTINVHMEPKPAYNVERDFQPISLMVINEGVLVANNDVPVKDIKGFLELVRKEPGKYKYGVSGIGSPTQMGPELLKQAAKLDMTSVPYKGEAPILTDVVGGQIPFAVLTIPVSKELIKAGSIRPLAILGPNRYADLPGVPTIAEAGFPEGFTQTWIGVLAPAGVPADIVKKLTDTVQAAMKSPEVVKLMESASSRIIGGTAEEFKDHIRSETIKWGGVVKQLGYEKGIP